MGDDGVIYGSTFIYNTSQNTVLIDPTGGNNKTFSLPPETFYWNMNIIEEREHCLEYDVYLTGSMEGTRPAGTYPTNESASLYYTNYLDHPCHKDTVSPQLPWESAKAGYEFYLVNANGEPVNTNGEVVPFANRVLIGKPQSKEIMLNNTVSTGADIAAKDVIPEGYTLYNPDASFTVVIDSGSTPSSATITDNRNVNGSSSKVTTFYYDGNSHYNEPGTVPGVDNYADTHVAFAVLLTPSLIPDAVVIDYGIPVSISLLANDLAIPTGTSPSYIADTIGEEVVLNKSSYDASQLTSKTKSLTLKHGTAKIEGDKLIYTPTDALMDEEEIIYYEVILNGRFYYSTVTVYPAQNIYYEDDFFTFTPEASWQTAGTRKNTYQAEDRPGTFNIDSIDFNNVYGYDAAYDDDTVTYSLGSAKYVSVNKSTPKSGDDQPLAWFTFRGTGFDLFSVTSNGTGTTSVHVYDSMGNEVDNFTVDTFYGYAYTPGDDETFLPDMEAQGGIYQIPVIRARNYDYGTYTVKVEPLYASFFDHQKLGSYDIYIDGVRIYDPAGEYPADSIADVYREDTEAGVEYIELRSNIISANDFYRLSTSPAYMANFTNFFPGAMFVDSISSLDGDINEVYKKFTRVGPNNEIYLSRGQAIAFYLSLDNVHDTPASIQLGMKVVTGDSTGTVHIMNASQETAERITVQGGSARYYDITNSFTWNKELLETKAQSGFKSTQLSGAGKDTLTGEYTDNEWVFNKVSDKWTLCDASGSGATLVRTESGVIKAAMAPVGNMFKIGTEGGRFTFTNESGFAFEYDKVISGSDYNADAFLLYHADGDGSYSRVKNVDELVNGGRYLMIYDSDADMLISPVVDAIEYESAPYKTLYPIVIMNNSDNIVSLTNLKVAFKSYADITAPKMTLSSNARAASFARTAVKSIAAAPVTEDDSAPDISDITTEFVESEDGSSAAGTLYIRTPSDIAAIAVGDDTVTDFTDNGDGTRTFAYTFDVSFDKDTDSYVITVTDENGGSSRILKTGSLKLVETEPDVPETTDDPVIPDEPETSDDSDKPETPLERFKKIINRIIEFFKSIIRRITDI